MAGETLTATLTALIEKGLSTGGSRPIRLRSGSAPEISRQSAAITAAEIADDLVQQAVASGHPLTNNRIENVPLAGGNTAEVVALLTLHAPFVFKFDKTDRKLAAEATMMRNVENGDLPRRFRDAWPFVYAIRDEAPFAYLMEYFPRADGWQSLEDRLYPKYGAAPPSDVEAVRLIQSILDTLFTGYGASINPRALPSVSVDYISRIRARLYGASKLDPRFRSRKLSINGVHFEPWQTYLDLLDRNAGFIARISAPFSTVAHGDPNPGNLMLRTDPSSVELKLIDPKEWQTGDYLFDVAKLTHFLEATGPIEKPHDNNPTALAFIDSEYHGEFAYKIRLPSWTGLLVDACLSRVEQFATAHSDPHWRTRYELGVAANLLGLPEGRLKKGHDEFALLLYAEGIRWLSRFCAHFHEERSLPPTVIAFAKRSEIEPTPIAAARRAVKTYVQNFRESEDRRGFQLLQWDPVRFLDAKPVELSLEHEARLVPTSYSSVESLKQYLTRCEGMALGEKDIPVAGELGSLLVRRYHREPGFQSVDRYYELKSVSDGAGLIPRMLSFRERLKTSEFMTWASAGDARALNLELPFVALEDTGAIVRLEFNWIDDIHTCVDEFLKSSDSQQTANPLVIASRIAPIERSPFEAVVEHTTFREKYGLHAPAENNDGTREVFQLNIDHIVAQSLKTHRIASYVDIDIAPSKSVTPSMLSSLIALANFFSHAFNLVPAGTTKVWRDVLMTDEVGH